MQGEQSTGRRIGAAALLLSASVMLSRGLGLVRETLLAWRAGAGASVDAYQAAFQIPDLLNYLLAGGALSIAFVPLYTKRLAGGNEAGAERLFATVLGTLTTLAAIATALLWWFAEPLVELQFGGFDAQTRELTVRLTRIVLPAQVFFIAGGILNGTLLARGRFGAAAAAPLLYNAGIIAGGLVLAPLTSNPVEGFSWGALAGAIAGPFLAPLWDCRSRVRIRWRFAPADAEFTGYLKLALPLMLGQSLLTVDEWYERWFGAVLGPGTVAQLGYARRLMLVPVAVVGQAVAAAALPFLARLWSEGKHDELNRTVQRTLQAGLALATLCAGGLAALAPLLVRVAYQHGRFGAADTGAVAPILTLLALAVPGWILQQIAVRPFYARGDTLRPMLLGTAVALFAVPLYGWLGGSLGAQGLALAAAIGITANALATLAWARRLHGVPDPAALAAAAARSAAPTIAAVIVVRWLLGDAPIDSLGLASGLLVMLGSLYAVLAFGGVLIFGDEVSREAMRRLVRRVL